MIRDILKSIIVAANDPPPKQAKEREGDPCVICGKATKNFCGLCMRAGKERTAICTVEESAICQTTHSRAKHAEGHVGEHDPEWVG